MKVWTINWVFPRQKPLEGTFHSLNAGKLKCSTNKVLVEYFHLSPHQSHLSWSPILYLKDSHLSNKWSVFNQTINVLPIGHESKRSMIAKSGYWLLGSDKYNQPGLISSQPKPKMWDALAACSVFLQINRQYLLGFGNTENRLPLPWPILKNQVGVRDLDGLTPGICRVRARCISVLSSRSFQTRPTQRCETNKHPWDKPSV